MWMTGGESTAATQAGGLVSVIAGMGSNTDNTNGGSGGDLILEGGVSLGQGYDTDLGGDVRMSAGSSIAGVGGEVRVMSGTSTWSSSGSVWVALSRSRGRGWVERAPPAPR